MHSAALAHHLATLGLVRWPPTAAGTAVPCYVEELPDSPDLAVAVITRPSFPAADLSGYELPELQVVVRHSVDNEAGRHRPGWTLAEQIRTALHRNEIHEPSTWAAGTEDELHVLTCTASSSAPVSLGPDQAGRPRWSNNFQLEAIPTA